MTIEEQEYESKQNIKDKGIHEVSYGTMYKIEVNGKKPKPKLAKAVDRVCLLYKSTLFTKLDRMLDKFMAKYHELPEEEQVRQLPDTVRIAINKQIASLRHDSEIYEARNKRPRPAMLINDEKDTIKQVVDVDYIKADTEKIDFPYQSITEIVRDKSLTREEKLRLCEELMELKTHSTIEPIAETEEIAKNSDDTIDFPEESKLDTNDAIIKYHVDMANAGLIKVEPEEDIEEEETVEVVEKPKKTVEQIWTTLKQKYPKVDAVRKLRWDNTKTINGETYNYVPAVITAKPSKIETLKKKYMANPNVHYDASYRLYIPEDDMVVYFFRVRESELKYL